MNARQRGLQDPGGQQGQRAQQSQRAQQCQRRILVDTNVWLDYFLPWRTHSRDACAFMAYALSQDCALLYAVHSLKDIFYLVESALKRKTREETGGLTESQALAAAEAAWGCVACIRENATAVGADESDAWLACKYRFISNDLEDNFIMASAQRAQVDYLVTSDAVLLRKATVEAHTLQDALALMRMEAEL